MLSLTARDPMGVGAAVDRADGPALDSMWVALTMALYVLSTHNTVCLFPMDRVRFLCF
jgi:hypothetical protein